jgi:predicted RNase H-like HicB family nuclease
MFKQLLLLLVLALSGTLQKGKTYEDYAELIRESHQLHIPADIEATLNIPKTPTTVVHENQNVQVKEKTVIKAPPTYSTNEQNSINPAIIAKPPSNSATSGS